MYVPDKTRALFLAVLVSLFGSFTILNASATDSVLPAGESWVLAATAFSGDSLPAVHEPLLTTIPYLITGKISSFSERLVSTDERTLLESRLLSERYQKLIDERRALWRQRDEIIFQPSAALTRAWSIRSKERDIKKKDREVQETTEELSRIGDRIASQEPVRSPVRLWKSAQELLVIKTEDNPVAVMRKEGISALLTGTVTDISGYLFVTVRLESATLGLEVQEVSAAGSWDTLDTLINVLAVRLMPFVINMPAASVEFIPLHTGTVLYLNDEPVYDNRLISGIPAGGHRFTVITPGHERLDLTAVLSGGVRYRLTADPEAVPTASVSVHTRTPGLVLYHRALEEGTTPVSVRLPLYKDIVEVVSPAGPTFAIIDPESSNTVLIMDNLQPTAKRLEKQRRMVYNSLAAFYISLPVSMLTYGLSMNKTDAWNAGRLEQTDRMYREIQAWNTASITTQAVSIGFAVNLLIQVGRYLYAAEQVVPRTAVPYGDEH